MASDQNLSPLVRAMCRPEFYSSGTVQVELRQTHISYAFLTDDEVFKVKKPVRFSFLDYSTPEKRRHYCEEEVRLNRRLAPRIYLGIVPIYQSDGEFALGNFTVSTEPIPAGRLVEYAVRMKRLDEARMLDRLVLEDRAGLAGIRAVARTLARFHASASADRARRYAEPTAIWKRVQDNLEEIRDFEGITHSAEDAEFLLQYSREFFDSHRALFEARIDQARVREGHGDLRAEHVNIGADGEIAIFDCVEFSESLRTCDVASEIAFLAMDLDFLEAHELSRKLIECYAEETGDRELYELLPFYQTYRALVRYKVEGLKSKGADNKRNRKQARRYFDLACRYAKGKRQPALLVTCGLVATGKSSLARRLRDRTGFALFNSDVVRKRLAGMDPAASAQENFGQGIYSKEFTDSTYAALCEKAEATLESGEGAVLDATFGRAAHREALTALARRLEIPILFIECSAPLKEVRRRLEARREETEAVSDATLEVCERQRQSFEPLTELGGRDHLVVQTDRPVDAALRTIDRFLDSR